MVQQSAEQAALVALTARQCHGVPADGKAQVILPRQAAHLTHQAVKSRCADINFIAQVVQVQASVQGGSRCRCSGPARSAGCRSGFGAASAAP